FYKSECFECHGSTGSGLLEATPDFGDPDFWSGSRADVYLIKAILEGIPNETLPEDERMPGYQDKINADQALALIEFKLKKFPEKD
ncbi:MAG: cytochrome c, partial [Candidatus Omnitrophica bacterium]|nr:cytochrome c [Candidatus Omnitrophota bacterium]